jgi:hypothetical protein
MYDPQIGRWITPDPIGFDAGDANVYRYVGNQTMIATDPWGLQERKKTEPDYDRPITPDFRMPREALEHLPSEERQFLINDLQGLLPVSVVPSPKNLKDLKDLEKQGKIKVEAEMPSILRRFHPGAIYGFRITVPGQKHRMGNQATFDSKGNLITEGPAAGTPDLVSPSVAIGTDKAGVAAAHLMMDVRPFEVLGWENYHKAGWAPINAKGAIRNRGEHWVEAEKIQRQIDAGTVPSLWKELSK